MTPAEIVTLVGEALYGSRWQTGLAEALRVNDRTVRRWVAGTANPSSAVVVDLVRLLEERQFRIQSVIETLKRTPMPQDTAAA